MSRSSQITIGVLRRLRSWGGFAGALAAVAGGVGAAVGLYSLPDPTAADVSAHVYAGAGQAAIAVSKEPQPDGGYVRTDFQMWRTGAGFAHVPESPYYP
ncbi:MAG: hypothetical protein ACRDJM_04770, partial [Actinomycetota bacterium]